MHFANIFQSGMVLQRQMELPVWGSGNPNDLLEIELNGVNLKSCVNLEGKFHFTFPPFEAGGPYNITLKNLSDGKTLTLCDVYIGEVYHASGQSNMEWTLNAVNQTMPEVLPDGDLPLIRMFRVKKSTGLAIRSEAEGSWKPATEKNVMGFSAVAFFFARKMQAELKCAVGIIDSSWGGVVAESYCSSEALLANPELCGMVHKFNEELRSKIFWKNKTAANINESAIAEAPLDCEQLQKDTKNSGLDAGFAGLDFTDKNWDDIELPGSWIRRGFKYNGILWFRKTVEIPASEAGKPLKLIIGGVDKTDITYFNGEEVGRTGTEFDVTVWNVRRCYEIPARLVKSGKNVIAIRARSFLYDGSISGTHGNFQLENPNFTLPLEGVWKCFTEANYGLVTPPGSENFFQRPAMLFNNMIAPLIPLAHRSVIFYQGESNTPYAWNYFEIMKTLISDWRYRWGLGNTMFIMVQLANYMDENEYRDDDTYAAIRNIQRQLLTLPNVGMASAIDIGEAENIHPKEKRKVGERLAAWELHHNFGKNIVPSGPLCREKRIENGKIRVLFDYAENLHKKGDRLNGFVLASDDRKFKKAEAVIEDNTVLISSDEVKNPKFVRYAWAENPYNANLYNGSDLPASPFEL